MMNDVKTHFSVRWGKIFFKFRAWIAVPFFILLVLFSRPVVYPFFAYALIITGFVIRVWAAGYIGVSARGTSFATRFRITTGPYRFCKHPLYCGNFFLVIGVVILFNPQLIYGLIIMALFIVMYGMITVSEQVHVQKLPEKKVLFTVKNCAGEVSTFVILILILVIQVIVPKHVVPFL